MPTYVYKREDGTTFELVQRITEPALETDPETGQKVRRIPSASAGLVFKGTGFYLTDYKPRGGSDKGDGTKGDGAKAGSNAEGGSETKTDTPAKAEPAKAEPATKPAPSAPKTGD